MSANCWLKNYHTHCCCYFHHSHIDTRPLCCHILSKTHGSRYLCRCRRLRLVAQFFFVPTGANWSEDSRNNMKQLHRSTICAQYYVCSYTNKRFTVPSALPLPSLRGLCAAVKKVCHRIQICTFY